jgi:hypothetical protein
MLRAAPTLGLIEPLPVRDTERIREISLTSIPGRAHRIHPLW